MGGWLPAVRGPLEYTVQRQSGATARVRDGGVSTCSGKKGWGSTRRYERFGLAGRSPTPQAKPVGTPARWSLRPGFDCRQPGVPGTRCSRSGVERAPSRMRDRGASKLPRTVCPMAVRDGRRSDDPRISSAQMDGEAAAVTADDAAGEFDGTIAAVGQALNAHTGHAGLGQQQVGIVFVQQYRLETV